MSHGRIHGTIDLSGIAALIARGLQTTALA
jgi:hypothetical protein